MARHEWSGGGGWDRVPGSPCTSLKSVSVHSVRSVHAVHRVHCQSTSVLPRRFQWKNERPLSIPKGLNHPAQGWPIPRGLPWVAKMELINPEGVESPRLMNPRSIPLKTSRNHSSPPRPHEPPKPSHLTATLQFAQPLQSRPPNRIPSNTVVKKSHNPAQSSLFKPIQA
jgi:hypothetical protein